jgi:hypothetical protein
MPSQQFHVITDLSNSRFAQVWTERRRLLPKKDEAPNGLLSVRRFKSFVTCLR